MARRTSMLVIFAVFAAVSVWSQQTKVAQQPGEGHVVPLKKFPLDQRFETVSGDSAKSGAPFVIRIHAEAGYIIMPHTHPIDENIVVVKGSWAVGMVTASIGGPLNPWRSALTRSYPKPWRTSPCRRQTRLSRSMESGLLLRVGLCLYMS